MEIARQDGRLVCTLDGRPVEADAVEVGPAMYSILLRGQSYEVRVHAAPDGLHISAGGEELVAQVVDPRQWRSRRVARSGGIEAEGRQEIKAPMPGKIVRVLAKAGDAVEAGQGLLVVEAMKMQNEIKAPKTGRVEKMLVAEGQAVNAGETVAVVS
ncbi:MAG TPA: biotin/lipoyl-containing protein [Candidatus Acidoferrales bacterium]|nr:biotin/lipoyl-containing protein [Candidatus Acidoferrales bacterium]